MNIFKLLYLNYYVKTWVSQNCEEEFNCIDFDKNTIDEINEILSSGVQFYKQFLEYVNDRKLIIETDGLKFDADSKFEHVDSDDLETLFEEAYKFAMITSNYSFAIRNKLRLAAHLFYKKGTIDKLKKGFIGKYFLIMTLRNLFKIIRNNFANLANIYYEEINNKSLKNLIKDIKKISTKHYKCTLTEL